MKQQVINAEATVVQMFGDAAPKKGCTSFWGGFFVSFFPQKKKIKKTAYIEKIF